MRLKEKNWKINRVIYKSDGDSKSEGRQFINFSIMCNYCLHKSLRGRWCGILTRPIVHLSTFGVTIYLAHRINSMCRLWMQKRKVLSLEWKSDVTTRSSLFSVRRSTTSAARPHRPVASWLIRPLIISTSHGARSPKPSPQISTVKGQRLRA